MENTGSEKDTSGTLTAVSAALFQLRDAFVELSLALKDWQFEADLEQRRNADQSVRHLLDKVR